MKETVTSLLAVITLAKSISDEFPRYWVITENSEHALQDAQLALNFLNINDTEFTEFKDDILNDSAQRAT